MGTLDDEPRDRSGDRPGDTRQPGESRRLAAPPSARYAARDEAPVADGAAASALPGPLLRAAAVALMGAALLTIVGAVLASTAGLLFVAGATGAAVGLTLSRAAVATPEATPAPRRRVAWLSVSLALGAVILAAVATWLIALGEGGVLGPIDYLLTTFGPFIPGEAILAAVAAWWGASTGPVQR